MGVWGVDDAMPPNCSNRLCMAPAEADWDGEPYCLACADLVLERLAAVDRVPALRDLLPPLFE